MAARVESRKRIGGWAWHAGMASAALLIPTALALMLPVALRAQQAAIVVIAHDSGTAAPLSGVRITLDHRFLPDTTDAHGVARLAGIAPGLHLVSLHLLGYAPDSQQVTVTGVGGATVDVRLRSTARTLPSVKTNAESEDEWIDHFDERRAQGGGYFFTHAEIDSSRTRTLDQLLRADTPANLIPGAAGMMFLASHSAMLGALFDPRPCWVQIWYDGVLTFNPATGMGPYGHPPDLRNYLSRQLEAVEFYPNPATTPIQFRTGSPSCGTLVLWSRRH